jgi:hypothetical protein
MNRLIVSMMTLMACQFQPAEVVGHDTDAMPDDNTQNACMQACPWGCIAGTAPHCGQLVPAGGIVTGADFSGTRDTTVTTSIDTGDGANMKPKLDGVIWSDVRQAGGVTIFKVKNLTLTGHVGVIGKLGLVIVATEHVTINGVIDATMFCNGVSFVGGAQGGSPHMDGHDPGGGQGSDQADVDSGGGGGNGGKGGDGGGGQQGGPAYGATDLAIATLAGGGGGGGGTGGGGPAGGDGGAEIQIDANLGIAITGGGGINAGGCGALASSDHSGGGGGAGGTILLEAPQITIAGAMAVNGGGGGAALGVSVTGAGSAGTLDRTPAAGGVGTIAGSTGAAGAILDGSNGVTAAGQSGGAGGGIGRIRINTQNGIASVTGTLSPALDDVPTTCTQAPANVQ